MNKSESEQKGSKKKWGHLNDEVRNKGTNVERKGSEGGREGGKDEYKLHPRASLVAQWLRICLPMQGTQVRALVWGDPTCRGATRPVSHNY